MKPERETLSSYQEVIDKQATEIERLRAALELISTTGPARHYEIAEKALAAAIGE